MFEEHTIRSQRRPLAVLFVAVSCAAIAFFGALTLSTVIIVDLTGSRAISGVPGALAIFGTAISTRLLSRLRLHHASATVLAGGWFVGFAGSLLCVAGAVLSAPVLVLAGMLLMGFGYGAAQLSRFAAADLVGAANRATALSLMVWGNAVGAVLGPLLLRPSAGLAIGLGAPAEAGGFGISMAAYLSAALVLLVFARSAWPRTPSDQFATTVERTAIRGSGVLTVALVTLLANQLGMVLVMTPTPTHIVGGGHTLGDAAVVMSSHFVGMFAFAPLIGHAVDRFGLYPAVITGLSMVALGSLGAGLLSSYAGLLPLPLLALGVGWSCTFVAASASLTKGVGGRAQTLLQGRVDAYVWTMAAVASLVAGLVFANVGYPPLGYLSAVVIAVTAVWVSVSRHGRSLRNG